MSFYRYLYMIKTGHEITQTIHYAKNLFEMCRDTFLSDFNLAKMLSLLESKINISREKMIKSGIVNECMECSLKRAETCCTYRTGFKCDATLLLINLLMNVPLPEFPSYPELCYFLTEKGCCLKARPVICINYTCSILREKIPFEKLLKVQEITGEEMDLVFKIENYIKHILKNSNTIT